MDPPRQLTISADSIRLGQFLKLADLVEAGGEVKALLMSGLVTVNGEPEVRRGRQLRDGHTVGVGGVSYDVVVARPAQG
ncbi:MAG: RNA-binding S4 domain-containing protein [Nocardioidaceae bacterium]